MTGNLLTRLSGSYCDSVFSEAQPGGNTVRLEFGDVKTSMVRRLTVTEARELAAALLIHADRIEPKEATP